MTWWIFSVQTIQIVSSSRIKFFSKSYLCVFMFRWTTKCPHPVLRPKPPLNAFLAKDRCLRVVFLVRAELTLKHTNSCLFNSRTTIKPPVTRPLKIQKDCKWSSSCKIDLHLLRPWPPLAPARGAPLMKHPSRHLTPMSFSSQSLRDILVRSAKSPFMLLQFLKSKKI